MDKQKLNIVIKVTGVHKDSIKINCTKCNYCLTCPERVNIPKDFNLYNDIFTFNNVT